MQVMEIAPGQLSSALNLLQGEIADEETYGSNYGGVANVISSENFKVFVPVKNRPFENLMDLFEFLVIKVAKLVKQ